MAKTRKQQAPRPPAPVRKAAPAAPPGSWSPLMPRQRALFYEQLARMLKSGLPAGAAMENVLRTPWPPALLAVAQDLSRQTNAGGALAEVLKRHAPLIDAFEAAYLEAAETAGTVAEGFDALARRHWQAHDQLVRFAGKLVYPVCLLVAAAVLGPLHVAFAGDVAGYLGQVTRPLAAMALGLGGAAWVALAPGTAPLRGRLYRLGTRLPFIAPMLRRLAIAQLGQLMASSFRAGLPAGTVLALAAAAMPDPEVAAACRAVEAGIQRGETIALGLSRHPEVFPHEFVSVVETGEQAGRLDESLAAASQLWQEDAERARDNLARAATGGLVAVALGMVALIILQIGLGILGNVNQVLTQ